MGKAEDIIEALGGAGNIDEIEACATRLRTVVNDPSLVDENALKTAGAFGVLSAGSVLQVIVGGEADGLAMDINDIIE
jgi:PTS system N-acetylglucosamine-specific IIB component